MNDFYTLFELKFLSLKWSSFYMLLDFKNLYLLIYITIDCQECVSLSNYSFLNLSQSEYHNVFIEWSVESLPGQMHDIMIILFD